MKQIAYFNISEPFVKRYKTQRLSNSFHHMFNLQKATKIDFYQVLLPILLWKMCQSQSNTYEVKEELTSRPIKIFPSTMS